MDDNVKHPKKIELTESFLGEEKQKSDESESLPVSVELNQFRRQYYQDFENSLRQARIELIRDIQNKRQSKVFVFYSNDTINVKKAEIFFEFLQKIGKQKKIDLFLLSSGGMVDQAFNMSRWCRHYADSFNVIIPHYAKSAATLLSLGADQLFMGPPSELGPIDPQISVKDEYGRNQFISALSIKDALQLIESLTKDDQSKALKYMPLIEKIDLKMLGQYNRAIESSKQYAADLLSMSELLINKNNLEDSVFKPGHKVKKYENVAHQLTEGYYSHGYAIGADKAVELGFNVIHPNHEDFDQGVWTSVWRLYKIYENMIDNSDKKKILPEGWIEQSKITTIWETDRLHIIQTKNLRSAIKS